MIAGIQNHHPMGKSLKQALGKKKVEIQARVKDPVKNEELRKKFLAKIKKL